MIFFFFKQKTAYEMRISDWSSDVCSSDLRAMTGGEPFDACHRTPGKPLDLYAHEVIGGRFEELEDTCVALKLPFVRSCDGYPGEWDPERVVFTGEGEPTSYPADEAGHVVMNRGTAERLGSHVAIIGWFDAGDFRVPPLTVDR